MGKFKTFIGKTFLKLFSLRDYKAFMNTFGDYLRGIGNENYKDWVFQAIDTWGWYFSKARFRVYDNSKGRLEEIKDHKLVGVFSKPNEWQSIHELKYKIATDLALFGNCYWYKLREPLFNSPVGIYQLRSSLVVPKSSRAKFIDHYVYDLGSEKIDIPPEDIIHFRYPDPESDIEGRAIIKNIMDDVEVGKYQAAYMKQFYKEGGFMGLTFSTTAAMNKANFDRIKAELEARYGSGAVEKNFKVALLDSGLQPVKAAYSMKDMEVTGNTSLTKEKILGAFKVPEGLLGKGGVANRSEFETLVLQFTSGVIDPILNYIDDVLTQSFSLDFGSNWVIKHDTLAPRDVDNALKYYKDMVSIGAMTIDEVREEEDWNPFGYELTQTPLIQGGGVLFDLQNGVALGQTLNQGEKGNNKPAEPQKNLEIKDLSDIRYKQYERRFEKVAEGFKRKVNSYFDGQLKRIRDKAKSKGLTIDDIFDMMNEDLLWHNMFESEYLRIMQEGFKHGSMNLNTQVGLFNITNPFVKLALARSLEQSKSINQTTKEDLIRILGDNFSSTNQEMYSKIEKEYKDIKEGRVPLIVDTTVTNGLNAGQFYAFKEAGVERKSWLSQRDPKVRNRKDVSHVRMDGEVRDIDEKFSNGLLYPGDAEGEAKEVCGCRCTLLPEK